MLPCASSTGAKRAPQLMQNIEPDKFLVPHLGQTIPPSEEADCWPESDFFWNSPLTFLNAACVSLAAKVNAFSNSIPT